jgi:hypothetical protein
MLPLITPVQNMPPKDLKTPGSTVYDTFMKPLVEECVESGKLSGIIDNLINDERYKWVLPLCGPTLPGPHTKDGYQLLYPLSAFDIMFASLQITQTLPKLHVL